MNRVNMNKEFVIIGIVVLAITGIVFSKITGTSGLERSSKPLVTQILQE